MTELERQQLSDRLWKAVKYAEKEWEFLSGVVNLELADAKAAYERFLMLQDAASDVYHFDFDKGE